MPPFGMATRRQERHRDCAPENIGTCSTEITYREPDRRLKMALNSSIPSPPCGDLEGDPQHHHQLELDHEHTYWKRFLHICTPHGAPPRKLAKEIHQWSSSATCKHQDNKIPLHKAKRHEGKTTLNPRPRFMSNCGMNRSRGPRPPSPSPPSGRAC